MIAAATRALLSKAWNVRLGLQMVGSKASLGDSHNFGRRVELRGARVAKPRTVFWEWLVLSRESPLRQLLAEEAARDGLGPDFFGGFTGSLQVALLFRSTAPAAAARSVGRSTEDPTPASRQNADAFQCADASAYTT